MNKKLKQVGITKIETITIETDNPEEEHAKLREMYRPKQNPTRINEDGFPVWTKKTGNITTEISIIFFQGIAKQPMNLFEEE